MDHRRAPLLPAFYWVWSIGEHPQGVKKREENVVQVFILLVLPDPRFSRPKRGKEP